MDKAGYDVETAQVALASSWPTALHVPQSALVSVIILGTWFGNSQLSLDSTNGEGPQG